jgi:hypothetical protein
VVKSGFDGNVGMRDGDFVTWLSFGSFLNCDKPSMLILSVGLLYIYTQRIGFTVFKKLSMNVVPRKCS